MRLTLDGLVRGLRWKAHALAEETEQRYRQPVPIATARERARAARRMRQSDDRPGR
jgi:predicted transcriptional regulator